jgi:hypothetical protein
MTVFHAVAGSFVIVSGLLLASVLLAAQGTTSAPTAQMNRLSHDKIYVPRYVPCHQARSVLVVRPRSAQMNRVSCGKSADSRS